MVREGVELLHVVQNRHDRVVIYRHVCEDDEDSYTFELQRIACCDWSPRVEFHDYELDDILTVLRSAQEVLKSSRSHDE
ncbi:MAG TPA: hypothetical protein VHR66_23945 [Gemmataceae bacterium]|nr:hypothetical protein [Gemmataceae bacterium]